MKRFNITGTKYTPDISFDPNVASFSISGVSTPENSLDFYQSTYRILEQYALEGSQKLEANIRLVYFNTSSAKCLYDIFRKLVSVSSSGKQVIVNWIYDDDDEDILESGEDYSELLPLEFRFVPVPPGSDR
ncbi:DUF1987 domain-containing protein [Imperialibacter roseus]|uniref:DUF1987 domain-containing protein n=1 Tax=Imperialibacter roseus TaxID=1324217 RepID=A0ABZ0IY82_9BACT|nr:DUF1987 domain-containing protein [Imperialibacter roseus]WOK09736.1 DUF1987 domain-containing protein [Imperialibacter roseus]|tara:strand:- start:48914 stop:49306 length:393 start_codon:yes stop_codon:yes gene_type:complete